jgi:hypothetical protein
MTTITRMLLIASLLCFLAWGAVLLTGLRPLLATPELQIIYGEHEDFYSDAAVFRKQNNDMFFVLHLPRSRPAYRWWTVDFENLVIATSSPPRTFRSRTYIIDGDLSGTNIDDKDAMGEWHWHFTETGASFSGNGFTCNVRKARK